MDFFVGDIWDWGFWVKYELKVIVKNFEIIFLKEDVVLKY